MPCYTPLQAYQTALGEVVFTERGNHDFVRSLTLPCGQCIGCRLERSRQWAMRCVHEASLYENNAFITLTYDDDNLPASGSLTYPDFQLFMKRLRKHIAPTKVRFYMCGEYGDQTNRPHFHACLFNYDFPDKVHYKRTRAGSNIYTSNILANLWPFGLTSTADVTFESAAYCARYCMSKVTGRDAASHYRRYSSDVDEIHMDMQTGEIYSHELTPEFNHMSLKPGIGAPWLAKWKTDVYPHDYVVINGKEVKPPKYYDTKYAEEFPDQFERLQFLRESEARSNYHDNTDDRLAVKLRIAQQRAAQLERTFQ